MEDKALQAIKTEFLKDLNRERITVLECRYKYGCAVLAIQNITADTCSNGRPDYQKAREIVLSWIKEADAIEIVSDNTLKLCTYISQHLNKSQVAMLAQKGMTHSQVYAMLAHYKGEKRKIIRQLTEIRSGRQKDFARWNRERSGAEPLILKVTSRAKGHGDDTTIGRIKVDLYDNRGNFDEERVQILFESLLTKYPDVAYKAWKAAMMRITKRVKKAG